MSSLKKLANEFPEIFTNTWDFFSLDACCCPVLVHSWKMGCWRNLLYRTWCNSFFFAIVHSVSVASSAFLLRLIWYLQSHPHYCWGEQSEDLFNIFQFARKNYGCNLEIFAWRYGKLGNSAVCFWGITVADLAFLCRCWLIWSLRCLYLLLRSFCRLNSLKKCVLSS